jgi:hypothetical protein
MDPALAPRRSGRARRRVEYKEPSSSSEGSIGSSEPYPTQGAKRKRLNDSKTQAPSNPYDPPSSLILYTYLQSKVEGLEENKTPALGFFLLTCPYFHTFVKRHPMPGSL